MSLQSAARCVCRHDLADCAMIVARTSCNLQPDAFAVVTRPQAATRTAHSGLQSAVRRVCYCDRWRTCWRSSPCRLQSAVRRVCYCDRSGADGSGRLRTADPCCNLQPDAFAIMAVQSTGVNRLVFCCNLQPDAFAIVTPGRFSQAFARTSCNLQSDAFAIVTP